jgi:membrane protein implicated in regulation of membrane protease activity
VLDCSRSIINCICRIFNRSRSFDCENNEYKDESISSENSGLVEIPATAVENFKKIGDCYYEGYVKANGTYWKSVCKICKISEGDIVIVKKFENLTLEVEPAQ